MPSRKTRKLGMNAIGLAAGKQAGYNVGQGPAKSGSGNFTGKKSSLFEALSNDAGANAQNQFRRDGTLYQYPMNLGDAETTHFVMFHIYSGHSQKMASISRGMNVLEEQEDSARTGSNWAWAAAAVGGGWLWGGVEDHAIVDPTTGEHVISADDLDDAYYELERQLELEAGQQEELIAVAAGQGQQNLNNPTELSTALGGSSSLEFAAKGIGALTGQNASHFTAANRKTLRGERGSTRILKKETRISKADFREKESIALYMPHKINELNVLEYEMQNMSGFKTLTEAIAGDVGIDAMKKSALGKITQAFDSVTSAIGLDADSEAYLTASMKMVGNPRSELLFKQPQQRKFEFNFEFAPRTPEESEEVASIIKTFKIHAYPENSGGGLFYLFPSEFQIEYYKCQVDPETGQTNYVRENDWLNRITRCALTEINIDYAPTGTYQTFENGAPTHINLSLTFGEMELLTRQHILEGH